VLDDFLPRYDVSDVHSVTVGAPPDAVMDAIRELTPREVPLLVALMAVRRVPALLSGHRPQVGGRLLDGMRKAGFTPLRDSDDELVFGIVGRFWRLDSGLRKCAADEFAGFSEPGFAKGAINFELQPIGRRTMVTTETRVAATDEGARRSFKRYWRLIAPGSALIRVAWLRAIRRRAERQAA
jgi:hypothetical protein